jgi:hypothetical protein
MTQPQIILSLITIICSGVASAIVTYKLNSSRDERQFLRKKLEEVNLAFMGYSRQLCTYFIQHQAVMAGKITFNDALDLTIKGSSDNERHHEKLSMLINIYFPHMSPHVDEIGKCREAGNDIIGEFKAAYLSGVTSSQPHNNAIRSVVMRIDVVEEGLKEAIRAEAKKINYPAASSGVLTRTMQADGLRVAHDRFPLGPSHTPLS